MGAFLMPLHHLIELRWEKEVEGGAGHENEGEDQDTARETFVPALPFCERGRLLGDTFLALISDGVN